MFQNQKQRYPIQRIYDKIVKILLIAVGNRMPGWVTTAYKDYATRLFAGCELQLLEIAAAKRGKNTDLKRIVEEEGEKILQAIPKAAHVVSLEIQGQAWSTEKLSSTMQGWAYAGKTVALLVGGPEGLSQKCLSRANQRWSLSPLTLPHPLVRVILAEQLFRAWGFLHNHPYHR